MKQPVPTFRSHMHTHEAVVTNRFWYGDGLPLLGPSFTAAKTAERQREVVHILLKAAKKAEKTGDKTLAYNFHDLADKLYSCRNRHRCGSLACPKCARAFQKAKVAAQEALLHHITKAKPTKKLVMVTVIPRQLTYTPVQLNTLDIQKSTRWFKDVLKVAGFDRVMFGSPDIGWEHRGGQNYYQLHWHIGMFTSNRKKLTKRLKAIFPGKTKGARPVVVSETRSLGFLAYMNKLIKLPKLLREHKAHLPDLLLILDRTEPLDIMLLVRLKMSAQAGRLIMRPIEGKQKNSL